ncbi:MAG: type II/IV secretion system protein [Planctomycetaceae bacterium]|nr:MAG: type II/IV secretion system protein [Planctomycetaceae bacterium]
MSETGASRLLNMDQVRIDPTWALRVPAGLAMRRHVLPFVAIDDVVHVACIDDRDTAAMEAVRRFVGRPVHPEPADRESLQRALNRIFGTAHSGRTDSSPVRIRVGDPRAAADPESRDAVALFDELLYAAFVRQASDIHLDPGREEMRVRFRVDGVLENYRRLPVEAAGGVVSRLKVLAGMDIAEKRAPQDGRFTHTAGSGQEVDIRVASLPTRHGEKMTLRLLALQTETLTVERLGMGAADLAVFEQCIHMPHGMVLLTGPTGSGKTTTLYAALRQLLKQGDQNVLTIEDPIEYEMSGVSQVEVDTADKVNFGKALRSILRHDPDTVMIGEIRDRETADVAIKAALTGHLVFSTLHTNSAASVVTRLNDMGVERYLIAATLRLAVAQRLVRRLCPHCRRPRELTPAEAAILGMPDAVGRTVYDRSGCIYCANRGFSGRLGLFELLPCDGSIARRIAEGSEEAELIALAREQQLGSLFTDAAEKIFSGETSVEEVLSIMAVR